MTNGRINVGTDFACKRDIRSIS